MGSGGKRCVVDVGLFDDIVAENIDEWVGVARWLDITNIEVFDVFSMSQNGSKLVGEGVELVLAELKQGKRGDLRHLVPA